MKHIDILYEAFSELKNVPDEIAHQTPLNESLNSNVTVYESSTDGVPELGKVFVAFSYRHRRFGLFHRLEKSKYINQSQSNLHISPDGEFYADIDGSIYSIEFDRYAYVDDLNLLSDSLLKRQKTEQEHEMAEIETAFSNALGDDIGEITFKAFADIGDYENPKNHIKVRYPFNVYQGELRFNNLSIGKDERRDDFIKDCCAHGMSFEEALALLKQIVVTPIGDDYTQRELRKIRDDVLKYVEAHS